MSSATSAAATFGLGRSRGRRGQGTIMANVANFAEKAIEKSQVSIAVSGGRTWTLLDGEVVRCRDVGESLYVIFILHYRHSSSGFRLILPNSIADRCGSRQGSHQAHRPHRSGETRSWCALWFVRSSAAASSSPPLKFS